MTISGNEISDPNLLSFFCNQQIKIHLSAKFMKQSYVCKAQSDLDCRHKRVMNDLESL